MAKVVLIGADLEENLALLYLDAALANQGHECHRLAFNSIGDTESVVGRVLDLDPDLVGLSMVFTLRSREFADLADRLRQKGCNAHITCGGHFASFNSRRLLGAVPALDSVVLGEGEVTLSELASRIDDPQSVAGLVLRSGGGCISTERRPAIEDLEQLPWPKRERYREAYLGRPIANMLSSRGCYGSCRYCSIRAWHRILGTGFRTRPVSSVANEMADLYHRLGVRIFNFHDDNFFLPRPADAIRRFRDLRKELDRRSVGRVAVAVKARPDSIRVDTLDAALDLGLFRVFLGIENGADTALKFLGRGSTAAINGAALDLVRETGIHAAFNLLLFNPSSTLPEIAANLEFLEANADFPLNFCRTEVYAGTPIEAELRDRGRLRGDWWGFDYRIDDPRVEALFSILHHAFKQRNFAEDGLHHLGMQVAYLHSLRSHFEPGETTRDMDWDARAFVRAVNLDTLNHLRRALAWAWEGEESDVQSGASEFADDLRARVDASRSELESRGRDLATTLESLKTTDSGRWGFGFVRSAAAAATTLALLETGMTGCTGDRDQAQTVPTVTVPPSPTPHSIRILPPGEPAEPASSDVEIRVHQRFVSGGQVAWMESFERWTRGGSDGDESGSIDQSIRFRMVAVTVTINDQGRVIALRPLSPNPFPEDLLLLTRDLLSTVRFDPGDGNAEAELVLYEGRRFHMCEYAAMPPPSAPTG